MGMFDDIQSVEGQPAQLPAVTGGLFDDIPSVDGSVSSPIELPPRFTGPELTTPTGDPLPDWPEYLRNAAKHGVEFRKDPPKDFDLSFTGFALDNKQVLSHAAKTLNTSTRMGPETGKVEYKDPESGRWTTLNPVGLDIGDFQSAKGIATVLGPEVIGGIAGSFISPVAGTAAVGSAGAFLGEVARLGIGRFAHGLGSDVPMEEWVESVMFEAAKESGLSLAGGLSVAGLAKVGKNVLNFIQNRWLPKEVQGIVDEGIDDQMIAIDAVNDAIKGTGQEFKPTAGEITGSANLLGAEEGFRRNPTLFGPQIAKQFEERDQQNVGALKEFFDETTGRANTNVDFTEVGERVTSTARQQADNVTARVDQSVVDAASEVDAARTLIPEADIDTAISKAKAAIDGVGPTADAPGTGRAGFTAWAKEAYAGLDRLAVKNGSQVTIPNVSTRTVANSISKELEKVQRLFSGAGREQKQLIGRRFDLDDEGAKTLRKIFDPKAEFTFEEIQLGISFLKSEARALDNLPGANDKTKAAVKRLVRAMVSDRERAARNIPGLSDKLAEVEQLYRQGKDLYFKGVVKEVMQKGDGGFRITDERAFRRIFQRLPGHTADPKAVQFAKALDGDRGAFEAMRNAMFGEYKRTVFDAEGKFLPNMHRKFMGDYSASMRPFFSGQDWGILQKSKTMGDAFRKISARRDTVVAQLKRSTKGRLSSLDPQKIRAFIGLGKPSSNAVTELDRTNIRGIKSILSKDEDAWNDVKGAILKDLQKVVFSGDRTKSSLFPDRLRGYLDNNKAIISEVFGTKVSGGLETLHKAMKISSQKGGVENTSRSATSLLTLTRMAILGPLSHTGFVLRGASRFRQERARKMIANSLLNPDSIQEMARLNKIPANTHAASVILGSMLWTGEGN